MKSSFLRMRKKWRAVLVVPSQLSGLAPHLRRKNFYPIVLPVGLLDQQQKELWFPRTGAVTSFGVNLRQPPTSMLSAMATTPSAAAYGIVEPRYRLCGVRPGSGASVCELRA
jgi:hypothetical protein